MTAHTSTQFKLRGGDNLSVGMANVIVLEIWEMTHRYACRYVYAGAGISISSAQTTSAIERIQNVLGALDIFAPSLRHRGQFNWAGWTDFSTRNPVDVSNFSGPRCGFLQLNPGGRPTPDAIREALRRSPTAQVIETMCAPYLEFYADPFGPARERLMVQLNLPSGSLDSIPGASLTGGSLMCVGGPYFKRTGLEN